MSEARPSQDSPSTSQPPEDTAGTTGGLPPEALLDIIADGVLVFDAGWRFTYFNAMAERLLGCKREELLGRVLWEVYPRVRGSAFGDAYLRAVREGTPVVVEDVSSYFGIRFEVRAVPREGHLVVLFRDVTARHQAEVARETARAGAEAQRAQWEALASRQRFLSEASTLLGSSLDYATTLESLTRLVVPQLADWCAVDMLTEDGRVEQLAVMHQDPARVEVAREVLRRQPVDLSAPAGMGKVLRTGQSDWVADIPEEVLLAAAREPETRPLLRVVGLRSFICVALVARGRVIGCLTLSQAESGRRYTEEDVRLAEDLARRAALCVDNARLYREAQEAIRVRDEFLSIASHELKTPLTSLRLQLTLIERLMGGEARERLAPKLGAAHRQVDRLSSLVNTLLDVSRIVTGRVVLELTEVDLTHLVQEALERLREVFVQAGCAVTLQAPGPVVGCWDALRLDQVIVNLLTNAAKYGQGRPVRVTVEATAGRARLIVRDEGIGIAAEDLPRLFGRFERAVSVRHYGGLGLGLYISRQIVEALGGRVSVDSRPGEGSTFTVELPRGVTGPGASPSSSSC